VDGQGVTIVDRVTLASGDAPGWLDRVRSEYAPRASLRGMRLAGSWSTYVGPDSVEVTVAWELPDVASFWAMRRAAAQDASVRDFWESTDAIALARDRNVCATA
jgi:hypothetical protein